MLAEMLRYYFFSNQLNLQFRFLRPLALSFILCYRLIINQVYEGGSLITMSSNEQKILIVEDEADTAEMLAEMVRLSGYQAECTYSGKSAIDMLTNLKPSLVLLDIVMPGISGLDVLNFMRCDPRLIGIPVIIISSNSMPSDKQTCLDAGASDYLTKPVSYNDLKNAIEKALHP